MTVGVDRGLVSAAAGTPFYDLLDFLWLDSHIWWNSFNTWTEFLDWANDYYQDEQQQPYHQVEYGMADLDATLEAGFPEDQVAMLKYLKGLIEQIDAYHQTKAESSGKDPEATKEFEGSVGGLAGFERYDPTWEYRYDSKRQVFQYRKLRGDWGDALPDLKKGAPRYTGIQRYGSGWWYGLDTVEKDWRYHPDSSGARPSGHADEEGWVGYEEYQVRLSNASSSSAKAPSVKAVSAPPLQEQLQRALNQVTEVTCSVPELGLKFPLSRSLDPNETPFPETFAAAAARSISEKLEKSYTPPKPEYQRVLAMTREISGNRFCTVLLKCRVVITYHSGGAEVTEASYTMTLSNVDASWVNQVSKDNLYMQGPGKSTGLLWPADNSAVIALIQPPGQSFHEYFGTLQDVLRHASGSRTFTIERPISKPTKKSWGPRGRKRAPKTTAPVIGSYGGGAIRDPLNELLGLSPKLRYAALNPQYLLNEAEELDTVKDYMEVLAEINAAAIKNYRRGTVLHFTQYGHILCIGEPPKGSRWDEIKPLIKLATHGKMGIRQDTGDDLVIDVDYAELKPFKESIAAALGRNPTTVKVFKAKAGGDGMKPPKLPPQYK